LLILFRLPQKSLVIITPRGAFTLKNKNILKKRIYSLLYFSIAKIKRHRLKVHYLTASEFDNSRFKNLPSFVVGNSIMKDSISMKSTRQYSKDGINVIFMGRFNTYIKGLDLLCDHIRRFQSFYESKNIQFNLYGPDSKDKNEIRDYLANNGIENVFIHPPVYGEEKVRVIDKADFHILTSRSEGFPMSVLETLARGCPQILSEGTNMLPLLEENKFGFVFDDDLVTKISELDSDGYLKMTHNAIECAEEHSSKNIALKTFNEYIR